MKIHLKTGVLLSRGVTSKLRRQGKKIGKSKFYNNNKLLGSITWGKAGITNKSHSFLIKALFSIWNYFS